MNGIVQFRKCTLSNDDLLKKVDNLTDLMYQNGKIPDRYIPARPNDDYDLLVGEMVVRFDELIQENMKLAKQLDDISFSS